MTFDQIVRLWGASVAIGFGLRLGILMGTATFKALTRRINWAMFDRIER